MVFLGLFFSGFNVIVLICLVKLQKCLKMLVFPSFGGFCGVGYSCLFGFGRFRCLVFLCLFFFFCFGLFFLVCFVFVLLLDCFWCWLLFCFCCLFFLFFFFVFCLFLFFVFFGGFKGQVRWPKGPPHLALNPPYVICFVFLFCVFCFAFLICVFCFAFLFLFLFLGEGLRVRWGGPKGHLTWP